MLNKPNAENFNEVTSTERVAHQRQRTEGARVPGILTLQHVVQSKGNPLQNMKVKVNIASCTAKHNSSLA